MTTPRKEDLREGLTRLVGGQKTDEIIRNMELRKGLTQLEERQIATQATLTPLSQTQAEAIAAYLHINVQQSGSGGDKK